MTLAQRAADELGGNWRAHDSHLNTMRTTMRLLARIDELGAELKAAKAISMGWQLQAEEAEQPTRRSEPMPEPVPDYIKCKVCEEAGFKSDPSNFQWEEGTFAHLAARLIWERGDAELVDPRIGAIEEALSAAIPKVTTDWYGWPGTDPLARKIVAALDAKEPHP